MNRVEVEWWWGWPDQGGRRPRLRHLYPDCVGILHHQRSRPGSRPSKGSGTIDLDARNVCRLCLRRWKGKEG